jgi:uncharacterized spore protein YtfJ
LTFKLQQEECMSNNVVEIIQSVVAELKEMARSESIVGVPVSVNGKTVLPVIKISVGFAVGGAQGNSASHMGGGGGGISMEPSAFIIMDDEGVSLLPAKRTSWDGLIEAVPAVAKKLINLVEKSQEAPGSALDEAK